jgi:myosin heavy subunit
MRLLYIGEASSVKDMTAVTNAAALFECDAKTLTAALVTQRKIMGRESILTAFNVVQAEANRDALCKAIYGN